MKFFERIVSKNDWPGYWFCPTCDIEATLDPKYSADVILDNLGHYDCDMCGQTNSFVAHVYRDTFKPLTEDQRVTVRTLWNEYRKRPDTYSKLRDYLDTLKGSDPIVIGRLMYNHTITVSEA